MDERSSATAVVGIAKAARRVPKSRPTTLSVVFLFLVTPFSVPSLRAQSTSPVRQPLPPKAVYAPKPVYRPEWAKQGLTGKGVVLVTIDKQTGNVTGARMLTSTGNQQLDGAALQAYSQWRFDPGTVAVTQLKMPIEFAKYPTTQPPKPAKRTLSQPVIILIILAIAGAAVGILRRRHS